MTTVLREIGIETAQFKTTAFPELRRTQGTNFPVLGLFHDATTQEESYYQLLMQKYGSGNLTLKLDWEADTATSGTARWGCAIAAITPTTDTQDIETKAFATAQEADSAHLGTTGQRLHQVSITITNLDAVADGDWIILKIYRAAAHANDTMTGDAALVGIELSYSDT